MCCHWITYLNNVHEKLIEVTQWRKHNIWGKNKNESTVNKWLTQIQAKKQTTLVCISSAFCLHLALSLSMCFDLPIWFEHVGEHQTEIDLWQPHEIRIYRHLIHKFVVLMCAQIVSSNSIHSQTPKTKLISYSERVSLIQHQTNGKRMFNAYHIQATECRAKQN